MEYYTILRTQNDFGKNTLIFRKTREEKEVINGK